MNSHKQLKRVLPVICREYNVTRAQLMRSTRGSPELAWARQVAMYVWYMTSPPGGLSWTVIGQAFSGRDRTTARHAIRHVEKWRAESDELNDKIEGIIRECSAPTVRA